MFTIIGILFDLIWSLARFLLQVAVLMLVSGLVVYGIWWVFLESGAGPYLLGVIVVVVVWMVIGHFGDKSQAEGQ